MNKITCVLLMYFFSNLLQCQNIIQEKGLLGVEVTINEFYESGKRSFSFGEFQKAIIEFTEAINISPKKSIIYANRADAKFALKNYFEAIKDYNLALKIEHDGYSYNNRGIAKYMLGDYRGAIIDYNSAIEQYEKDKLKNVDESSNFENEQIATIYINIGNSKNKLKDYQSSLEYYNKALEQYNFPNGYFNRGMTKIQLDLQEEACLDFSKSGELGYEIAYKAIEKFCN